MVKPMVDDVIATLMEKHSELDKQIIQTTIKHAIETKKNDDIPAHYLPLTISVSYDMWWQKKGSGKQYDSNCGHSYFIDCRTGKVVTCGVLRKLCSVCTIYEKRQLTIPSPV